MDASGTSHKPMPVADEDYPLAGSNSGDQPVAQSPTISAPSPLQVVSTVSNGGASRSTSTTAPNADSAKRKWSEPPPELAANAEDKGAEDEPGAFQ